MGLLSEVLAFSNMILCNRSLITVAVLVAGSGLPVGSPPYILAHPGITGYASSKGLGDGGHIGIVGRRWRIESWLLYPILGTQ